MGTWLCGRSAPCLMWADAASNLAGLVGLLPLAACLNTDHHSTLCLHGCC